MNATALYNGQMNEAAQTQDQNQSQASAGAALSGIASSAPRRHNNILVMSVCAALIAAFGYFVFTESYNFDIWYLLATGREIIQSGIPYENVFSMVPDLQIVLQQWLLCVIYYVLYDALGFGGVALFVCAMFFLTMVVLYRIVRVRRRDTFGGEWIMMLLLPVMLTLQQRFEMISTPVSILILALVVLLLELYRRDGRYWYLGCIVALVIAHMQVHMSFVVFDLAIIVCYLIPDFISPLRHWVQPRQASSYDQGSAAGSSWTTSTPASSDQLAASTGHQATSSATGDVGQHTTGAPRIGLIDADYKRLPLLILLVVSTLAMLVNPYGIDGALYLVNSFGAASYGNVIPELRPLQPFTYGFEGICAIVLVLLSAAAIGKAGLHRIDLPAVLIFIACTYLGFAYMRNIFMLGLPIILLGGDAMRGWYIPRVSEIVSVLRKSPASSAAPRQTVFSSRRFVYPEWVIFLSSVICTAGVGVFAILVAINFTFIDDNAINTRYTPQSLLNAIARDVEKTATTSVDGQVTSENGVEPDDEALSSETPEIVPQVSENSEQGSSDEYKDLKIFNPTVLGGYMEWQGFPVYNDSRVEIWNSSISGSDRDLHNEYVDMTLGKWSYAQFEEFIAENDFDYLIAETNSYLHEYLAQSSEFQNILGTQYYELYKKL